MTTTLILLFHFSSPKLGEVFGDQLGHFKHVDYLLAAEHCFQVLVGYDVALVFWILQVMLLDIHPQSLHYF